MSDRSCPGCVSLSAEAERLAMLVDAMAQAAGGCQVTDFELSHGPVRLVADLRADVARLREAARAWAELSKPAREEWMNDEGYQRAGEVYDRLLAALTEAPEEKG
jgi:hypothetical protein